MISRVALSLILAASTSHASGYNISVIAGTGSTSGSIGDGGPGTSAKRRNPRGLAVDKTNSNLYISEYGNSRVRRLSLLTGIITTFAGTIYLSIYMPA